MKTAVDLIRKGYRARLRADHIPLDPDQRTPEQQQTATLEFWAAQNEVALDAGTLTQAAVEGA